MKNHYYCICKTLFSSTRIERQCRGTEEGEEVGLVGNREPFYADDQTGMLVGIGVQRFNLTNLLDKPVRWSRWCHNDLAHKLLALHNMTYIIKARPT